MSTVLPQVLMVCAVHTQMLWEVTKQQIVEILPWITYLTHPDDLALIPVYHTFMVFTSGAEKLDGILLPSQICKSKGAAPSKPSWRDLEVHKANLHDLTCPAIATLLLKVRFSGKKRSNITHSATDISW